MNTQVTRPRGSAGRTVAGLFLLAIGALMLAGNLGLDVPRRIWSYWPFLLLALGLVKLLWPGAPDDRRSGFWLVVVGLYGWINLWHLFGLDWGSSWPIFLIAAGVTILFEGFGGRRERGEAQRVS
jgi:hypothetical protein